MIIGDVNYVLICVVALILSCLCHSMEVQEGYAILIDAGSTGSRAFIYDLTESHEKDALNEGNV